MTKPLIEFSLVIPVYNEAGNLRPLTHSAIEVLRGLGRPFEIILFDDGSTDDTHEEIVEAQRQYPELAPIRLTRNTGQAAALLIGLQAARGDYLLMMDGDGQNDPADFPALIALVTSNQVDLACGWRVHRHDSALRKLMSRLANAVRRTVLNDGVHDAGCQLRVMRQAVRTAFFPMELMQSFIPALAVAAGFRVGEIPVQHHRRTHGQRRHPSSRTRLLHSLPWPARSPLAKLPPPPLCAALLPR